MNRLRINGVAYQPIHNLPINDSLVADSAIVYNHKLVTRNIKDFNNILGLEIINPWNE